MSRGDERDGLRELRALADQPRERAALARQLLKGTRAFDVIQAALRSLSEIEGEHGLSPDDASLLRERYRWFHAAGTRRDQGCFARVALLNALRSWVEHDDRSLLEDALTTYEWLPAGEVATFLRASALLGLARLDPEAAEWQATRLLLEPAPHTQAMTGEPARTAAKLLAAHGRPLPIYALAASGRHVEPELLAECLRLLASELPAALLEPLVAAQLEHDNPVVMLGAIDLALEHEDGAALAELLADFLGRTKDLEVHRYLCAAIVASRKPPLAETLLVSAEVERDTAKHPALRNALDLLPQDERVTRTVARLQGGRAGR